jgi:prepilin-type N-terminal cleavage/methylation domain-containing protein
MRIADNRVRKAEWDRMQDVDRICSTPNAEHRMPNSTGFTLVEAIITIVIVGIISSIAAMIILQGIQSYTKEQNLSDAHYQARLAMERMTREIRTTRQLGAIGTVALGTITGNPTSSLIFTDLTGATITYSLGGTTLNRTVGGVPSPLATGVTTLQFRHYDSAGVLTTAALAVWTIEIDLTDTQGVDVLQMRTRVHPRNF